MQNRRNRLEIKSQLCYVSTIRHYNSNRNRHIKWCHLTLKCKGMIILWLTWDITMWNFQLYFQHNPESRNGLTGTAVKTKTDYVYLIIHLQYLLFLVRLTVNQEHPCSRQGTEMPLRRYASESQWIMRTHPVTHLITLWQSTGMFLEETERTRGNPHRYKENTQNYTACPLAVLYTVQICSAALHIILTDVTMCCHVRH